MYVLRSTFCNSLLKLVDRSGTVASRMSVEGYKLRETARLCDGCSHCRFSVESFSKCAQCGCSVELRSQGAFDILLLTLCYAILQVPGYFVHWICCINVAEVCLAIL